MEQCIYAHVGTETVNCELHSEWGRRGRKRWGEKEKKRDKEIKAKKGVGLR